MRTDTEYIDSLRARNIVLYVDGERIAEPVEHPLVRPSIDTLAMTFAMAHREETKSLATAWSELIGARVNRFTHLFTEVEDLVAKVKLQRVLGRATGTCFQRCVGMDALNAMFIATHEAGPHAHARFIDWLAGVQQRDDVICGAMTDAKGNRRLRPPAQPDAFLHVAERRPGGVVLRGAKLHQTGAANSHWVLVMPGQGLRDGEEDFAIAAALPVDAPGLTMVLGRQPSDHRKSTPDAGNIRYSGQECVLLFDDVFVPQEHIFLDGDIAPSATLLHAFAGFHRASYGGCKPGNLDVLTGAVAALTEETGVRTASHVRSKLVEMVGMAETIHGLGLAASHQGVRHDSGVFRVDSMLANVCKQAVTRLPYEAGRIAEDLAGGLVATLPELAMLDHPLLGAALRVAVGGKRRAKLLRLVENLTYGSGAVPLRIECMHGAGSPQAQQVVIERLTDWDGRVSQARRLAGIEG
jgi:4-hydroxybutyryl-CoA dehydratase / vinylacetyl-CoA-Delta-isomerase